MQIPREMGATAIESGKRVTLKMIAQRTGASIGTVDRAINNREGIKPARRDEILAAAREMGYRPNQFASALRRSRALRIGVAFPIEPREFYHDIDLGIDRAAEAVADYGVTVEKIRYRAQDPEIACRKLETVDPRRYDGIAVNSAGANVAKQIDRFVAAGVPTITFNTDAPESARLFFIGHDARQSGVMAGELLDMLLGGQGGVAVVSGSSRANPFLERSAGFSHYMHANCPEMHVFSCSDLKQAPQSMAQNLTDLLRRVPDVGGVFCTGYGTTVGAAAALEQLGRQDIRLVGYDITPKTAQTMQKGFCSVLLYQNPYQQGYQAVRLLARHLLEGWRPEGDAHVLVDTRIVIRSNLDSYLTEHRDTQFTP